MSAAKLRDLVKVNIATTGTGTVTFGTVTSAAFYLPSEVGLVDGDAVRYVLTDGTNREEGTGVIGGSVTTMTRTVKRSRIAGTVSTSAKINLSGASVLILSVAEEDILSFAEAQTRTEAELAQARVNLGIGPCLPGGRVTLTSGVPVTESDVAGATTIYYVACAGQYAPAFDGTAWREIDISAGLSLALDSASGHTGYHQSGKLFDVWCAYVSGTTYFGTGPAWTSDTARGTGAGTTELDVQNGIPVNKNSMTLRFGSASGNTVTVPAKQATLLGTIRCTADGVTEDSIVKRFVSNAYNTCPRTMKRFETTASWTYSTAAWRQANASASNQIDFVNCLSGRMATAYVKTVGSNSSATPRNGILGIGLDRTNGSDALIQDLLFVTTGVVGGTSIYQAYPGLGFHSLKWVEFGAGADTQTWYGASAYGMMGSVEA